MNELPPNAMFNTIDTYIIITLSIVNNPYPYHPYKFITENYSSKFTIKSFWVLALNSPAENPLLLIDLRSLSWSNPAVLNTGPWIGNPAP